MNILAIETASSACSVAVFTPKHCVFLEENTPQAHARHILPMVNKAMETAGITPEALGCLAFDKGPGAFTGLRIATAVIQGLALGWDKPVIGIGSLEALAYQAQTQQPVLALLDARMGEVYAATFQGGQCVAGPVVAPPEQLVDWLENFHIRQGVGLAGDHQAWIAQQGLAWTEVAPRADAVAALAMQRTDQAHKVEVQVPTPLYLRDKVADKPKQEV